MFYHWNLRRMHLCVWKNKKRCIFYHLKTQNMKRNGKRKRGCLKFTIGKGELRFVMVRKEEGTKVLPLENK